MTISQGKVRVRDTGGEGEKGEGEAVSDPHFWWWMAVAFFLGYVYRGDRAAQRP